MSFKLPPPVEIYNHSNNFYYTKTKKPCKYTKEQTEEMLKIGKYILKEPQGDCTPVLNRPKVASSDNSNHLSNMKLIASAAEKGIKISNKVALKLKSDHPDYTENDFDVFFDAWGAVYDSVSYSQKKKNNLAYHKKKNV